MDTRRLGPFEVPVVGLGCNNFGTKLDETQSREVVRAALDAGITLFDTADIYGMGRSEEYLGRALGSDRDRVILATKFRGEMYERVDGEVRKIEGTGGASPEWIARAVEESLRRLGTDVIDLYQIHAPDDSVAIADTLAALDGLVEDGKVRAIGCSNFSAAQIDDAMEASAAEGLSCFVSVQNHYSLLHREPEPEVVEACERHGLGLLPYFPLASGVLTGKYRSLDDLPENSRLARMAQRSPDSISEFLNEGTLAAVGRLSDFCEARGRSLLELAISWLLAQPAVSSVISGATTPEQATANVDASGWSLTPEELAEVDSLLGSAGRSRATDGPDS